jgi:hypothetical protein
MAKNKVPFEPEWFGGSCADYFRKIRPNVDALPWGTIDHSQMPANLVLKARLSWTEAAYNEYCTAVAFAQLVKALLEINAPIDMVAMASDFLADEMLHVEMTARLAQDLGGGADYQVDFENLYLPLNETLTAFQKANELIIRLCCVGEAFSLPMLSGCYQNSIHPLTKQILKQIVVDEAHHGKLGFLYLEWAEDRLDDDEKHRLAKCAIDTLRQLSPLWKRLKSQNHNGFTTEGFKTTDIQILGWMFSQDYQRTAKATIISEITAPLAQFGIILPQDQLDDLMN